MHRQTAILVLAAAVLAAAGGGCELTRKNYQAVTLGQNADQARKILGAPRYQYEGQWIYTRDDPRDLTKVEVYFDADGNVIGKAWQNPEKPWENHREGQTPGA